MLPHLTVDVSPFESADEVAVSNQLTPKAALDGNDFASVSLSLYTYRTFSWNPGGKLTLAIGYYTMVEKFSKLSNR